MFMHLRGQLHNQSDMLNPKEAFKKVRFTAEPKAGLELKMLLLQPLQCWDVCQHHSLYKEV